MVVWLFVAPFVVLGAGVLFVAFSGGPSRARQRQYLNRGRRAFRLTMVMLYVALGIAVPALVLADGEENAGATGSLVREDLGAELEDGKELFLSNCSSCHDLDAANANGVTGPDLDDLAPLDEERVLTAIANGGTGQDRMPAAILEDENAAAVAAYVAAVAGR